MAKAQKAEEKPKTAAELANDAQFQNPGAAPDAHGAILEPQRSGATVTVGCKLGVAFYDIQLSEKKDDVFEQNMQGGRTITAWSRIGDVVRLRGTAYPRGTVPDGFPPAPIIVGGAAMNPGIPKEFWDAWVEQHRLDPLVVNKFIFAHESRDHVEGLAKDRAEEQSGLEPINPKGDKRMPKSTRSEISDVSGTKPGA